jgi:hypothetical protein
MRDDLMGFPAWLILLSLFVDHGMPFIAIAWAGDMAYKRRFRLLEIGFFLAYCAFWLFLRQGLVMVRE